MILSFAGIPGLSHAQGLPAADASNEGDWTSTGPFVWERVPDITASTDRAGVLYRVHRSADENERAQEAVLGAYARRDGALWRLIEVHDFDVEPAKDAVPDNAVDELNDGVVEVQADDGAALPEGFVEAWHPLSWTKQDCGSDGEEDLYLWDVESRTLANTAFDRPKTAVRLHAGPSWNEECSGVVLRDHWVLTAAHCVSDSTGVPYEDDDVLAYLPWKSSVPHHSDIVIVSPWYSTAGGNDYSDDWALVRFPTTLTSHDMDLSSASDATITAIGANVHNLGFPAYFPQCTSNLAYSRPLTHTDNNEVTAHPNKWLRWKGDAAAAQSGGPLYYCPEGPNDVCGAGEPGFVIAVMGGWSPTYNRLAGAKMPYWRDILVALMDTN